MELLLLVLTAMALPAAARPGMASSRLGGVPPGTLALLRSSLAVSGSQHDLELVQFIPLSLGPLSVRYGQKRLQAGAGGNRLRFIHRRHYLTVRAASLSGFVQNAPNSS